jgi:SAM-dependent methyltransferase
MSDWAGAEGEHWADSAARYTKMLRPYGDALLAAAGLARGEHVLDVGCGNGDVSVAAARHVGDVGTVVGVDLSPAMLDVARARAREAGLGNVTFVQADASRWQHDDGVDVLVSRFGVMFFDDPLAAFTTLRSSVRPGGRLAFLCWQDLLVNEWMIVPGGAVAEVLPLPVGDPGAPGPFAFADADRTRSILEGAGFSDVAVEPVAAPMWMGDDPDDAVAFLETTGMGRIVFADAPPDLHAEARTRAQASLEPHHSPDGVVLGGAAWLVTARSPA